jgi:hypothetical protein
MVSAVVWIRHGAERGHGEAKASRSVFVLFDLEKEEIRKRLFGFSEYHCSVWCC